MLESVSRAHVTALVQVLNGAATEADVALTCEVAILLNMAVLVAQQTEFEAQLFGGGGDSVQAQCDAPPVLSEEETDLLFQVFSAARTTPTFGAFFPEAGSGAEQRFFDSYTLQSKVLDALHITID